MIATIYTSTPQQFKFKAMLSGLHVDEVSTNVLDVTYRDPHKVLNIIKQVGGTVVASTSVQPLTKQEMFA